MTQPIPHQTTRTGPAVESTLLTLAILAAVMFLLSVITFVPRGTGSDDPGLIGYGGPADFGSDELASDGTSGTDGGGTRTVRRGGGGDATALSGGPDGDSSTSNDPGRQRGPSEGPGEGAPVNCAAGQNGGDLASPGVSANTILIGASTVEDGPGASFLGPMRKAMEAVVAKVNSTRDRVCGRTVELSLHDSAWNPDRGLQIIRNLVEGEKVFALGVVPDSEGLALATERKYLEQQGVPVVGTDGLLISQYVSDYIWPVATPTASAMYAIATSQCDDGLKDFSIVFETTYRFGREGAKAYNLAARKCTGDDIHGYFNPDGGQSKCEPGTAFCGIQADHSSYSTVAPNFCSGGTTCTAGALLLEPTTAQRWLQDGGRTPAHYQKKPGALGSPQPLFTKNFASACKRLCDGLRLWTGFKPPLEKFASEAGVQQYKTDVLAYDPNIDFNNQFVEGAYLGTRLLVEALQKASGLPGGLTRNNLIAVLNDTANWDIGLTVSPLSWKAGNHFAQTSAHAFDLHYGDTGFGGWSYTGVVVKDPNPKAIL